MKKRKASGFVSTHPDALMNIVQASAFLGVSPRTIRNWRSKGKGPAEVRISDHCRRWRPRDLVDFVNKNVTEAGA